MVGRHHPIAARRQRCEVVLNERVGPHADVHGRHQKHGASGCHDRGRQHVVRESVGDLGDRVGGRGRQKDKIRPSSRLHVRHRGVRPKQVIVGQTGLARQRGKGQGGHESGCSGGHDHRHVRTFPHQGPHQISRLVGSNPATHAQQQPLLVQGSHNHPRIRYLETMKNSTRRFTARPASVALSSIGRSCP